MRHHGRRWAGTAATALLLACAACSMLIDHGSTQCQSDSDCSHFGGHPFCQAGVCVPSGMGPPNCFYGSPSAPQDFMNQCSMAACLSFDNCARLGLCGGASDLDASLVSPPAQGSSGLPGPGGATDGGDGAMGDGGPGTSDGGPGGDGGPPALPSCVDPTNGRSQAVVLTGSSNFPPLLTKLAPLVLAAGYTPIFQVTSSCNGVKTVFSSQPNDQRIVDPAPGPKAKYAAYFKTDGSSVPCSLGPGGLPVDVGESDIFSTTCAGFGPPGGGIGEYLGPIQAMVFVVPGKSPQSAITAEAAREVFGMGGNKGAAQPWTDPSLYFIRNANTGTQQMVAHAVSVPATQFWGTDRGTAENVDALMRVITDPTLAQKAIGIISADFYDADRANLNALAFRAPGQECAYLPDSTQFKKDKRNVRDGHYPIWGPVHFFTQVNHGVPVSPGAQAFLSVVSVPNIPRALLDAFISSSLIPTCAMQVQRSSELGPLMSYKAPFQCGCYFEASPDVNGAAPAGCTRCNTANDCTDPGRPACNLGYCEAQ